MSLRKCLLLMILMCLAFVRPAYAEFETGVYGGAALTNKTDKTEESSLGVTLTSRDLKTDTQFTFGGRVGYWFDRFDYVGTGLDVFYFRAKAPSQTVPVSISGCCAIMATDSFSIPVVAVAFDVLRLRLPLMRSEEFPHGRIQPYIGGGPAVFFSWAKAPAGFQPSDKTDVDAAIGYKVGGGLAIMLNKEVGLFAEYRYTHFTSSLTFQDNTPPASTETFKTTLNTNHAIVGLTVRFP